jgi:hypothetical protein
MTEDYPAFAPQSLNFLKALAQGWLKIGQT